MKFGIVLTGGIATGKSTVAAYLKLYGFSIIDADKIAHKILEEKKEEIKRVFGSEIIKEDRVNRKALGKIVFSDKSKLKKLEEIVSNRIKEEIFSKAKGLEKKEVPYFIDIPLFFEKKENYSNFKKVVLVYAPKEIQLERLLKRDKLNKNDALKRIKFQIDIEVKKELADFVVDNSKDLKHLEKEIKKLLEWVNAFYQI